MQKRISPRSLIVILGLCMLSGCNSTDYPAAIEAIDTHTKTILPEYVEYVSKDLKLDPTTKDIRLQSADSLMVLMQSLADK